MDKRDKRNVMNVNISNVFSPIKSVHHMSEQVFDVDYTATLNDTIENHKDKEIFDRLEKAQLNITNKQ